MTKYHEVTVKEVIGTLKSGIEKTQKTVFLVDAMSVTEAESKVISHLQNSQMEYTVIGAKQSRIAEVLLQLKLR